MGAPIGHTCPTIDGIKEVIAEVIKEMESISVDDSGLSSTIEQWRQSLVHIGHGNNCDIEELRSANAALRDWGHDSEDELEEVKSEKYRLETQIEELNLQIEELQEQCHTN